jgi:DNA mismatch endonuclease (patch repair protein)
MRAVRSKDTKIERIVASYFGRERFRFRRNVGDLTGKPDFALKKYKVVIFIDSCFWHGCTYHCRMPGSNQAYWKAKIDRNKERDMEVNRFYANAGWTLFRFWEHDIKDGFDRNVRMIRQAIKNEGINGK